MKSNTACEATACNINNCQICLHHNSCDICVAGFTLDQNLECIVISSAVDSLLSVHDDVQLNVTQNSTNNVTQRCANNCAVCNDKGVCTKCISSFFELNKKTNLCMLQLVPQNLTKTVSSQVILTDSDIQLCQQCQFCQKGTVRLCPDCKACQRTCAYSLTATKKFPGALLVAPNISFNNTFLSLAALPSAPYYFQLRSKFLITSILRDLQAKCSCK